MEKTVVKFTYLLSKEKKNHEKRSSVSTSKPNHTAFFLLVLLSGKKAHAMNAKKKLLHQNMHYACACVCMPLSKRLLSVHQPV